MAFVNEPISEEDRARLNMKEITGNLPPELYPYQWAIYRERKAYLMYIPILGIPEDRDESNFIFSWNDKKIPVRLRSSFISGNTKAGKIHVITWHEHPHTSIPFCKKIDLPSEIISIFREALTVYSNRIAPTEVRFTF